MVPELPMANSISVSALTAGTGERRGREGVSVVVSEWHNTREGTCGAGPAGTAGVIGV